MPVSGASRPFTVKDGQFGEASNPLRNTNAAMAEWLHALNSWILHFMQ